MDQVSVRKAVLSTVICNTLVWYDYILFGSLAGTIGAMFFPNGDRYSSIISTFCVFAVGFFMRPFGASIFGHVGDKYGRKVALILSIVAMSAPIGFMVIIPTYESVGALAPVLLVICRLAQGISLGGEAGNATFLIEHSKKGNSGLFGSFEVFSAVLGAVFALAAKILCSHLTGDAFEVWGWRIPFAIGLAIGLVSIYIRARTAESPAYSEHKQKNALTESPVKYLFQHYKRPLLLAICIDCIENCSFHIFMVFFISFVRDFSPGVVISAQAAEIIEMLSVIVSGVLTVAFGALSDVLGKKQVIGGAAVALFIVSVPVFWLLSQGSVLYMALGYLIFAIPFSAALGPSSAAMSELFPTKVRYTGFGISRNLSSAIGGGIAPAVCTWLIQKTGWIIAPGFYIMFWAVIACFALSRIRKEDIHIDWLDNDAEK